MNDECWIVPADSVRRLMVMA